MLNNFNKEIKQISELNSLEELRLKYIGKKGIVSYELKSLGKLDPEIRKEKGQEINKIKNTILEEISKKKHTLQREVLEKQINDEKIDLSLPRRNNNIGSIHPISKTIKEITEIFNKMGFTATTGPEIEDDFHNFTALNIDKNHPARQMHDTFYLNKEDRLLRTHTSSVQIRTLKSGKPPFAIISPGKTYRSDSDSTHTPMFHQMEALFVGEKASMANLKYAIKTFLDEFFKEKIKLRFRSSFFPFTEPSAEVDIECKFTDNKIDLKGSGDFLEIMGCGLIHPNVLKSCNIDPTIYSGFALGVGVERIAMLKYGIKDLRKFFNSEQNWTKNLNLQPYA